MSCKRLLYAPNIHQGGGKTLLLPKLRVRPILYTFKSRPSQSNRPGLVKSRH